MSEAEEGLYDRAAVKRFVGVVPPAERRHLAAVGERADARRRLAVVAHGCRPRSRLLTPIPRCAACRLYGRRAGHVAIRRRHVRRGDERVKGEANTVNPPSWLGLPARRVPLSRQQRRACPTFDAMQAAIV